MSTSAPKTPADSTLAGTTAANTHPVMPPPVARAARKPSNTANPLQQRLGELLVIVLCLSLPLAAGIIPIRLMIASGTAYLWLWIPLFIFIEIIACLCAFGIFREATGWASASDYQR
ncbi:MAG TPA: hypothetical protein VGN32_17215 [Ktedonobacterales bacterium]|jgi:uncharacterized RDD family membrane protein YckC|nr:hypothetical protein [Ktedonobacterales bacterium]